MAPLTGTPRQTICPASRLIYSWKSKLPFLERATRELHIIRFQRGIIPPKQHSNCSLASVCKSCVNMHFLNAISILLSAVPTAAHVLHDVGTVQRYVIKSITSTECSISGHLPSIVALETSVVRLRSYLSAIRCSEVFQFRGQARLLARPQNGIIYIGRPSKVKSERNFNQVSQPAVKVSREVFNI